MVAWLRAAFPAGSGLESLVAVSRVTAGVSTQSLLLKAPPVSRSLKIILCISLAPALRVVERLFLPNLMHEAMNCVPFVCP